MMERLIVFMVVSVLISGSNSQSFASSGLVDSYGNALAKTIYTDSNGVVITDGVPEVIIGLVPPLGNANEIEARSRLSPEPILIIKPPPPTRRTTSYTTTPTTTRVPLTFRTNPVTFRTNPPTFAPATFRTNPQTVRTTQPSRIFTKAPAAFVPRQQTLSNAGNFRGVSDEGKYRGKGDDGYYRPRGNNGAYVHDNSGAYRHTSAGLYRHDDRGKYRKN